MKRITKIITIALVGMSCIPSESFFSRQAVGSKVSQRASQFFKRMRVQFFPKHMLTAAGSKIRPGSITRFARPVVFSGALFGIYDVYKFFSDFSYDPFQALRRQDLSIFKYIIQNDKAALEKKDWSGATVLISAVKANKIKAVLFLLENGANIHARDRDGMTVLHHAADQANESLFKILIQHGADLKARDDNGKTALHHAVGSLNTYTEIYSEEKVKFTDHKQVKKNNTIEQVVAAGVDVNAHDNEGKTALHYAADNQEYAIIKSLISLGAKPEIRDNEGHTAHDILLSKNYYRHVVQYIEMLDNLKKS